MNFEDKVKTSFEKVREEFLVLKQELNELKQSLNELKEQLSIRNQPNIKPNFLPQFSIGNHGVPADRQTDRPTVNTPSFPVDGNTSVNSSISADFPTQTPAHLQHIPENFQQSNTPNTNSSTSLDTKIQKNQQINELTELMETLKTDLKNKFRSLTKQEFYIFSVLFTVDKTQKSVTYNDLAVRTGLTPSSIRDYTQRIIKKGVPIVKEKINNKVTVLKIPPELRNLATLDALMRLRQDVKDKDLNSFTNT